jgi:hypothetical protein
MVQDTSQVDGRVISRRVLGEMSAAWEQPWREALEWQDRNPDVKAIAVRAPDDFAEAAHAMVECFARFHPTILRTAIAHCQAVAAEFAYDDVVSPPRDDPQVVREHTFGGGQQQDRAVQHLKAEIIRLRAENQHLLDIHQEDRECAQAAFAALRLLLERERAG